MQDFTDSPGWHNIPRPQKMIAVGLVLIGLSLVWFGHLTPLGDKGQSLGTDLMLFAGIYGLVHELAATKKRLRNIQQVIKTENVNVACQTVNMIEGGLSEPPKE